MKVGVEHSAKIKEKSQQMGMSFAEVAWCYVAEDLLSRIYTSEFKEVLWLLGGYRRMTEDTIKKQHRLEFYYIESTRPLPMNRLMPGQVLSPELMKEMFRSFEVLGDREITWNYVLLPVEGNCYEWQFTALVSDMEIPISVRIMRPGTKNLQAVKENVPLLMETGKSIEILTYAPENKLSASIWEIMSKLELINDMESYAIVNEILENETINGRHIMEELTRLSQQEPKVLREKRLEQLQGYQNYGYMRKRWQQYQKRCPMSHKGMEEEWEVVMGRICTFMAPIWKALCNGEIFFDDWMPALGRFLG